MSVNTNINYVLKVLLATISKTWFDNFWSIADYMKNKSNTRSSCTAEEFKFKKCHNYQLWLRNLIKAQVCFHIWFSNLFFFFFWSPKWKNCNQVTGHNHETSISCCTGEQTPSYATKRQINPLGGLQNPFSFSVLPVCTQLAWSAHMAAFTLPESPYTNQLF